MRKEFDEQLATLNHDLIQMGAMCEESIALAAKLLTTRSPELPNRIKKLSVGLDRMERDVENLCLKLLLQQQPVAGDLRHISAALKMITDMERMGDQAEDIAEITLSMQASDIDFTTIHEMAKATIYMVTGSVDAFVQQDVHLAEQVIESDDVVDRYFNDIKATLIKILVNNPNQGENVLDLLMIAKYFERIGDHATNIAEWVVFSVTGQHKGEAL